MLTERELSTSIGETAYSSSGDKIGTVEHYFLDDRTGAPTWVAVSTGLFGTRHSIAPATGATFAEGALRLPVSADAVKSAPRLEGNHLEPGEEELLRRHYGIGVDDGTGITYGTGGDVGSDDDMDRGVDIDRGAAHEQTGTTGTPSPGAPLPPAPTSYSTPAPAPDPSGIHDSGMVRSEERLQVGTERVAATRVRLVKYVVTEEVQITVPIRREEIRVEEVPIDTADDGVGESLVADDAPADDTDGEHSARATDGGGSAGRALPDEIVLHSERPVVGVEVVPRERVRLRTELVQGQETVTGQVQREQIVVDQTTSPGSGSR